MFTTAPVRQGSKLNGWLDIHCQGAFEIASDRRQAMKVLIDYSDAGAAVA